MLFKFKETNALCFVLMHVETEVFLKYGTFKQKSNNFVVNAPKNRTVHSFIVIFDFLENRFLVGYPVVGCKRLPV